jgi:cobalt-zinc-cadmium efflux system protein
VLVAGYILYEAYRRFLNPPEIQSIGMLAIAVIGLAVNLAGMRLLRGGAQASLNVKGAYLEVWADMIGSLGVMIAAIAIFFTQLAWIDTVIAAGLAVWVVPRTWTLLKDSLNILLEGVPAGLALNEVEQAILAVPGVQAIHDLHVWALTSGRNSLTVHIVIAPDATEQKVLAAAADMLAKRFALTHTTIQVESAACGQEDAHSTHSAMHEAHQHTR